MNNCFLVEFSASKYLEGTNRLNLEIAKHLVQKGHNVSVVSPLWQSVSQHDIGVWEKQGIKLHFFSAPFIANPVVRTIGYFLKCLSLSMRQRFDTFAGVYTAPAAFAAILLGLLLGRKNFAIIYEPAACEKIAKIPFGNLLLQKADRLCTLSETVKKNLIKKNGIIGEKISVIPGFVDLQTFNKKNKNDSIRKKFSLKNCFSILFVGRISRLKGIPFLLHAVALAKAPIKLLLAGREVPNEDYKKLAKELRIKEKVFFLGYVSDNELPWLFNACNAFCLPSLSEGFGMVLAEAMACGKPLIVSDAVPLPEVSGNAGIVVPKENAKKLAEAFDKLHNDKRLFNKLSENALKRAKLFEKEGVMKQFEEFFSI